MSGQFVNVSGINPHDGARRVFVWCRDKALENIVMLGSASVIGEDRCGFLPGIEVGQFSVTVALPIGCAADAIFVTDENNCKVPLPNMAVKPCFLSAGSESGGSITSGDPTTQSANRTPTSSVTRGPTVMARSPESQA
jgi:hypothetical protein